MTEETVDRRTTLKVLGAVGAAGLAGLGTASGHPSPGATPNWEASEVGSTILDERQLGDEPVIEEITEIAGINEDGNVAGTGRTEDGTRAAFWWNSTDGYRSLENAAVHGIVEAHIVGERDRDGETQAILGHMDPAQSSYFFGDGPFVLPSMGGDYSAAHGVDPGQDEETVVIGVTTTEDGEEQIVQWEIGEESDGEDEEPQEPPSQATLRIEGTDEASFANYEVVIDDTAELGEMANSSEEVTQNDDGTVTVSGTVGSGTDSFTFTGSIVSAEDVAGARYLVDGEEYVPDSGSGDDSDGSDGSDGDGSDGSGDSDGSDGSDGDDQTEHVLRVYGTDEANFANYEVYIDGTASTRGSANPGDVVVENDDGTVTAAGTVGSGVDDYSFTGDITGWNEVAGARITVDGDEW